MKYSKKITFFVLVFFTIFLGSFLSTYAALYYVDPNITDTNVASATPDFTTYNPVTFETTGGTSIVYKTVADINLKSFSPGDYIYFKRGGIWNEQLTINQSGTAGNPITIDAFGSGDKPIFNGGGVRDYAILFSNRNYITVQNVQAQNAVKWDIFTDGSGSNISINNVDTIGGQIGIYSRYKSNSTYSNITVSNATHSSFAFIVSGDATTTNISADHITANNNAGAGIYFSTMSNLTATNLTAQNNGGDGIEFLTIAGTLNASNLLAGGGSGLGNRGVLGGIIIKGSTNLTYSVTNSTSSYNMGRGLLLQDLRNGTISGTVDNVTAEYNKLNSIEIGQVTDTVVRNSIARYSTEGNGISVNTEASNITLINDITNNNYWDGISFHGTGSNFIVSNCNSFSNGNTLQLASGDGYTSHDTIYNLSIYNSIAHDNLNSGFAMTGSSSGAVYNSVFYNNGVSPFTRGGYWVAEMTGGTGWTIKNNIFSNNYPYEIVLDSSSVGLQTADNNLYYHPANDKFATLDYGVSDLSWDTYHGTYESHSMNADPKFIDANNFNFDTQTDSLAIDNGDDVSLIIDKAGNPRYGSPDIGIYEYQPAHNIITDTVDIGAGLRIYKDGKFRDLNATNGSMAHLKITPLSGTFTSFDSTTTRPVWLDITNINNWIASHKTWTESTTDATLTNTLHTIGDLENNKSYVVTVDGNSSNIIGTSCTNGICLSNGSGEVSFTYTGTYSSHIFDIIDSISPIIMISSASSTSSGFQVTWTTNEESSSQIEYGINTSYGMISTETNTSPRVTIHSVFLSGLSACTNYHYRIRSKDSALNELISDDKQIMTGGCRSFPIRALNTSATNENAEIQVVEKNINQIKDEISQKTTFNIGASTLKLGSEGESVKELQRFLNQVLKSNLKVDGKLGYKTIAVVKKWQKANGLKPDGIVGKQTKNKILATN